MKSNQPVKWHQTFLPVFRFVPWQSAGLLLLFAVLAAIYAHNLDKVDADSFWAWADPVAGILSFFLTVFILFNQAHEKWKDSLEKRLTVNYMHGDHTVARVENAYLAGESDIRPWAQQLGRQLFGELAFDMNWDDKCIGEIRYDPRGEYFVYYEIDMKLLKDPLAKNNENTEETESENNTLKEFLKNKDLLTHSEVIDNRNTSKNPDEPKIVWRRKISKT